MPDADLAAPSTYVRDPRPNEAALVITPEHLPDLMALVEEHGGYEIVERAPPSPNQGVMHYIRCESPLAAERLEQAWFDHRVRRARQGGLRSLVGRLKTSRRR